MTICAMVARCNCGGEGLALFHHEKKRWSKYSITCDECKTNSGLQNTVAQAIATWNVAMGQHATKEKSFWDVDDDYVIGNSSNVRVVG